MTDKLTQLTSTIYCCRSGSAADTQAIADIIKYYASLYELEHDQTRVDVVANLVSDIVYQNKQLSAGIIVAGVDAQDGGSVYSIPLGGSLHKQPFAIGGSGSTFIYGYCDSKYKDGMSRQEAVEFVKSALELAMKRDGSSGGVVRIGVLERGSKEIEREVYTVE